MQRCRAASVSYTHLAEVLERDARRAYSRAIESSEALFGAKRALLDDLDRLREEAQCPGWDGGNAEPISELASARAEAFLREFPDDLPLPDLGVDPDGAVALDWIASRYRRLSLSLGDGPRCACAWIDGASCGHAIEFYEGRGIPRRLVENLRALYDDAASALRPA